MDTPNATSLPVSEAGVSHCASLAGLTTVPSGLGPVRANLSARQAKAQGLLTSGTYGPHGTGSLPSVALASSLASRLKQRLTTAGSTLFKLTWKEKVTPSGRSVSLLRASALRTVASDSGSWVSPQASDGHGAGLNQNTSSLCQQTRRCVAWSTPQVSDSLGGGSVTEASCRANGVTRPSGASYGAKLRNDVLLVGSGQMLTGSIALMVKRGQLNPAHSRWLMGFPPAWDDCAVTAMPSSRKSRQK
jgi:hypothetical protein